MKSLILNNTKQHSRIIKRKGLNETWLYLLPAKNNEVSKEKKLLHLEDFLIGSTVHTAVTDNYVTADLFSDHMLVEELLKCMGLDWLYSPIKNANDKNRDLYIQTIVSPLFMAPNFAHTENIFYGRNIMCLNIVLNKYSDPRRFIRDYFARLGIDTNLTEFMEWLDFTSLFIPTIYQPLQRLYSIFKRVDNPHKLVIDKGELLSSFEQRLSLLEDAIRLGESLDHPVNGVWSIQKLRQINVEWSREKMYKKIKEGNQNPLYTTNKVGEGMLLDTQLAVYNEGMHMGHCVYTNYWDLIKRYDYVAIHLPSNEDKDGITVGIRILRNPSGVISHLRFDQAFYKYDRSLSSEDLEYVHSYFEKYYNKLFKIIKSSEN